MDRAELEALLIEHGVDAAARGRILRALASGVSQTWSLDAEQPTVSTLHDAFEGPASVPAWSHGSVAAWPEEPASEPEPSPPILQGSGSRFDVQSVLGEGGMGTVYRAWDRSLHRFVALKVLRTERMSPANRDRFLAEARATAALEHPGIVPVHALDVLPDGRVCFAMRQIRGHTLRTVIAELHGQVVEGATGRSWTRRRVIDAWQRVCEAVAYAHDRGVSHRDLKPDNIMVGPFGEVLVLDWGLAQSEGQASAGVSGTPRYMAPEQAGGQGGSGPRSDVYSLGILLWEIVTGRAAFDQVGVQAVLRAVREIGAPLAPPEMDEELADLYRRATARDPQQRPAHAGLLAEGVASWLDGARRRAQALEVVEQATALVSTRDALLTRQSDAEARVKAIRQGTPLSAPMEDKRALWAAEDAAHALALRVEEATWRRVSLLEGALTHVPDLPEALAALASYHREEHGKAEALEDRAAARAHERQLRRYDRGTHAAYLQGDGSITLTTEPPAQVHVARLELRGRRLVPGEPRSVGTTPLTKVPLPMGSYLLTLSAPGHAVVRYPVRIDRCSTWNGSSVRLPLEGDLGPQDVYVPPGPFRSGTRSGKPGTRPFAQRWLEGWVVRRHPVTNLEYMAFLDHLVATGRTSQAERWVPRERGRDGQAGSANYALGADGRHRFVPDGDGDLWNPRWPVFNIDWHSAHAYAAWLAEQEGVPWTLPPEEVWEKAARGVDGRVYPWGETSTGGFANTRGSLPNQVFPTVVESFATDESVYGVRGMGGNVREYTNSFYDPQRTGPEDERTVLGGCWFFGPLNGRLDVRYPFGPTNRGDTIGFRLARRWS